MTIEGTLRGGEVRVGGDARQRFHDSGGYGRPLSGNEIALSRVEAAHLLFRDGLDAVRVDGEPQDFASFFAASAAERDRFALWFFAYADLRSRGFYLSPVRDGWPGAADLAADRDPPADAVERTDLVAYPRGGGPGDGEVEYRLRVVGEREPLPAGSLDDVTLAVVDEESDVSYFAAGGHAFEGGTGYDPPGGLRAALLDDRAVVWDPPGSLYERGFYGRPLSGREAAPGDPIQLSLVEAAFLAGEGKLALTGDDAGGGPSPTDGAGSGDETATARAALLERGRSVEGERFDRRLRVYERLRERGAVPKTGFKFGADFRVYGTVETVSELPHSEHLVRVVEPDHVFDPRELSLDVRLAGGVRKRMVFGLAGAGGDVEWLSVRRETP